MFVTSHQATQAAREAIGSARLQREGAFALWGEASVGQPVLVRDVFRQASYWLVPVVIREYVVGFVRLLGAGAVSAVGSFCQDPRQTNTCPRTVTGITAAEASQLASKRVRPEEQEVASEPVFVHDGPPGREAWLVEVTRAGTPVRWIFVTPAFIYERVAGSLLEEGME